MVFLLTYSLPVRTGGCIQMCSSAGVLAGLGRTSGSTAWYSSPSRVSSTSESTLLTYPCSLATQAGRYTSGAALALVLRLTTAFTPSFTHSQQLHSHVHTPSAGSHPAFHTLSSLTPSLTYSQQLDTQFSNTLSSMTSTFSHTLSNLTPSFRHALSSFTVHSAFTSRCTA